MVGRWYAVSADAHYTVVMVMLTPFGAMMRVAVVGRLVVSWCWKAVGWQAVGRPGRGRACTLCRGVGRHW